ncbi:hypothetical protein [Myroides odoratus]|uniref:hypothetical protein n=1 Tax=Myroides odoratus TaxID=256 RepID=UPI000765BDBB|nr:hypothetical protein [Myroides odoratus]
MSFFSKLFGVKNTPQQVNEVKPMEETGPTAENHSPFTLNRIAWAFSAQFYTDAEEFNQEVIDYQNRIYKTSENWKPNEVVFDFPKLQIQYMAWVKGVSDLLENETLIEEDRDVFEEEPDEEEDNMYQVELLATFTADNGKHFTALEFLLKTHNQQVNKELGDHVFFEGTDENPSISNDLPTCYIACGS